VDETPSNVVEELVRDAVAEQKAKGVIPQVNEAHRYIQGLVEDLDKRQEGERLRIKPKPTEKVMTTERSTAQMESEYEKRLRRHGLAPLPGSWSVTREPAKPEPKVKRIATLADQSKMDRQRKALQKRRLRARLRLLASKPDWADKLKRINPLALQGQLGEDKQKHAEHLVMEVIRASDAVFGPWMKAPGKKLWFT
jgi:hypothetical protein